MADAIRNKDLYALSKLLYNVMEDVTVPEYPVISQIKDIMINGGALNSIMSGSGPTVFGLFDNIEKAEKVMENLTAEQSYGTALLNGIY